MFNFLAIDRSVDCIFLVFTDRSPEVSVEGERWGDHASMWSATLIVWVLDVIFPSLTATISLYTHTQVICQSVWLVGVLGHFGCGHISSFEVTGREGGVYIQPKLSPRFNICLEMQAITHYLRKDQFILHSYSFNKADTVEQFTFTFSLTNMCS